MHRIIKAHLDSFVKSHSLEAEDEADQFEKFVNFSVIASETPSSFELDARAGRARSSANVPSSANLRKFLMGPLRI